jgi:hypothetical protein
MGGGVPPPVSATEHLDMRISTGQKTVRFLLSLCRRGVQFYTLLKFFREKYLYGYQKHVHLYDDSNPLPINIIGNFFPISLSLFSLCVGG